MIEKLNPQQRRLLALAILLLALGAVFSVSVLPVLLANQHYRDTIDGLESRLQQLQRAAAIGDTLQPQYEQLKRWRSSDAHYLKSNSAALAAAELQRLVKRIIVAKNAEVVSTQILTTRQEEGFDRVSLKVRIRGELENIVQAFHVLESGEPFVFLENVSVRASRGRRVRGQVAPLQALDIDMELIAYMPISS
ncbi:MAG: type II secretion system protein GspM [Thiogranum sp.]